MKTSNISAMARGACDLQFQPAAASGSCAFNRTLHLLRRWMMSTSPTLDGCTVLNFSASHDGIGLRPWRVFAARRDYPNDRNSAGFGGRLTSGAGERTVPYEMNTTLFSALKGSVDGPDAHQIDRFIASQTIMMSLEGIPAFYVQSFLAAENDEARAAKTGQNRSLNRTQWRAEHIDN